MTGTGNGHEYESASGGMGYRPHPGSGVSAPDVRGQAPSHSEKYNLTTGPGRERGEAAGEADVTDAVTHRELAAEIKAIEERMDRRQAEVMGRIDSAVQAIGYAVEKIATDVNRHSDAITSTRKDLKDNFDRLSTQVAAIDSKSGQDKRTILTNLWAIVLAAAIAGLAAIWATNSLVIASFQSGAQSNGNSAATKNPENPASSPQR